MKKLIILILLVFVANMTIAQVKSIKTKEGKRKYLVYLPKDYQENSKKNFPIIFNFHGGGMTGAEQMFYSEMNKTADKHGFIVVYPTGKNLDWNVGFEMSYKNGTDDIGFVKAILDSLKKDYRIDQKSIYACGLSRGGFFTHRIASELPEIFAAIASVSGPLPDSVGYFHQSKLKIGVMMIQGTDDKVVNFEGKLSAYASAKDTFDYWAKHNMLDTNKVKRTILDNDQNDGTEVEIFNVKESMVAVSLVKITGGGHTWPGSNPFNIGLPLGRTSKEIDINEVIWGFFRTHHKN